MKNIMNKILLNVQNPARYIGGETNTPTIDENARVKFCLLSPEIYEVGMSDYKLLSIYHKVNDRKGMKAERCFAPWLDYASAIKKQCIKLSSLESQLELSNFDILMVHMKYVNDFTTLLYMLDLGGVPLKAEERTNNHPIVIGYGEACVNPEVCSSFMDAIIIGDAEEVVMKVLDTIQSSKTSKLMKADTLEHLSRIGGIYVPSLVYPVLHKEGYIHTFSRPKVKKAVSCDLDRTYYPTIIQIPNLKSKGDAVKIEPIRGCTRGCRFCQYGYLSRPIRERRVSVLSSTCMTEVSSTGFERIAFESKCIGEYSKLGALMSELGQICEEKKTKILLPNFENSHEYTDFITLENEDTVKVSIEAGSFSLRNKINKILPEERIFEGMQKVFDAGYKNIKLYFMIGLPYETGSDLLAIIDIARKIKKLYQKNKTNRKPIYLSCIVSSFVAKPFTPFAWCEQINIDEAEKRFRFIKKGLKDSNIRAILYSPEYSVIESILSRGNRKVSDAIINAYKAGAVFDRDKRLFNFSAYKRAFLVSGVDIKEELSKRDFNRIMPWENVDILVSRDYLISEYEKAKNGIITPDCRMGCKTCGASENGVCKHGKL